MTMNTEDKYGDTDFDIVPRGPFKGRPWTDLKALTLHSLLSAVDFGLIDLDERRVLAIRNALARKGCPEAGGEG